jgi:hypothetical protein
LGTHWAIRAVKRNAVKDYTITTDNCDFILAILTLDALTDIMTAELKVDKMPGKLSIEPYRAELKILHNQFKLIRDGVHNLPKKRIKQFLDQLDEEEERELHAAYDHLRTLPEAARPDLEAILSDMENRGRRNLRRKQRGGILRDPGARKELMEDRLNQSELLLLVALFESFMKHVHRAFLAAAPQKVFGRAFRGHEGASLKLSEIFDERTSNWNSFSFLDKFLNELIGKEVKWLDQQNIEQRLEYFQNYYRVVFRSDLDMKTLARILTIRNEISHRLYAPPARRIEEIPERPLVADALLDHARSLFSTIPDACFTLGRKMYPQHFE